MTQTDTPAPDVTFDGGEIVESNKIYRMTPGNYYEMLSKTAEPDKKGALLMHRWARIIRDQGYAYVINKKVETVHGRGKFFLHFYVEGTESDQTTFDRESRRRYQRDLG